MGVAFVFVLLLLVLFTYAYHLALTISVIGIILFGFLLSKPNNQHAIISTFELNNQGLCTFEDKNHYQLQANSRFSFLGCWLILQPVLTVDVFFYPKNKARKKLFFIYRDSLSQQDFSRLSNVITQLNHQR